MASKAFDLDNNWLLYKEIKTIETAHCLQETVIMDVSEIYFSSVK